jgi:glycosyltransferase involved in cell wall biosynthesis
MTAAGGNDLQTVVMATDVPFWRGSTGAEQRMLALGRYLSQPPFRLVTFFVGQLRADDPAEIARSGLEVVFFESERPPEAFLARMAWYAEATARQLRRLVRADAPPPSSDPPQPLRVADYQWPWAIEQFRSLVRRVHPRAILCQYVTMTYLLGALSAVERRRIRCLLDTHDILHDRSHQFGTAGYRHWLEIDRQEEVELWKKFDAVLAIQPAEAELIARLAPGPEVLVTPHSVDYLAASVTGCDQLKRERQRDELVLGYIGSANYSNWHAINRFLIECWPELSALQAPRIRLLVAGRICDWFRMADERLRGRELMERVELAGEVIALEDFYCRIDVAINPVRFGTGLKIKNIEALAFGCPLVTTPEGAAGMDLSAAGGVVVAGDFQAMTRELAGLARDPERRRQLAESGRRMAAGEYSDRAAFAPLRRFLLGGA